MNREYRAYRKLFIFLRIVLFPFFRYKFIGRENIPDGPAIVCSNHSSNLDPIMMAFAAGIGNHLHFMSKVELFRIPFVGSTAKAIGTFPVNRGMNDVGAIKRTMTYLKAGEKVAIFPEGKRIMSDDEKNAKPGAVRIADQMSVPIIPVYIPRKKKLFHTITIVIGQPYNVNPDRLRLTQDDYNIIAESLMAKISVLKPKN